MQKIFPPTDSDVQSSLFLGGATSSTRPDAISTEFMYYSAVLKSLAPSLSDPMTRERVIPWLRKLFRPEYHSSLLREKRNKYLVSLIIVLLNDELYGPFRIFPPPGPLESLGKSEPIPLAQWECETMWQDIVGSLPPNFKPIACSVHSKMRDCLDDHFLDEILDEEFQYMLYLAKPYAMSLSGAEEKTRAAAWLQVLCSIEGNSCSSMRGIRNDYIMLLVGYIQSLRVDGPFSEYPTWKSLRPLQEITKDMESSTQPTGEEAELFLSKQPVPEEGAFCYITITANMTSNNFTINFNGPDKA